MKKNVYQKIKQLLPPRNVRYKFCYLYSKLLDIVIWLVHDGQRNKIKGLLKRTTETKQQEIKIN